jgi:hypothetical protein
MPDSQIPPDPPKVDTRPAAGAPYPAPDQVPATGSDDPADTRYESLPTPDIRGTILFSIVLLMAIFGFWVLMYMDLLAR